MDIKLPDMKILGPGTWFLIHLLAYHAVTPAERKMVMHLLWVFAIEGPCMQCTEELQKLLEATRGEVEVLLLDTAPRYGIFDLTVKLHNLVNARLGKRIMTPEEAHALYAEMAKHEKPCSGTCTGANGEGAAAAATPRKAAAAPSTPRTYNAAFYDIVTQGYTPGSFKRLKTEYTNWTGRYAAM